MNLYQKLATIESKVAGIESKLGLPQRRHLLVRQLITNHTTKTQETVDTLILPKPYITTVSPRYVNLQVNIEGADSIFISINDLQVEIPRTYPNTLFSLPGSKTSFVIDPPVDSNNQIVYTNPSTKALGKVSFYTLSFLSENEPTIWKLILRKEKDSK